MITLTAWDWSMGEISSAHVPCDNPEESKKITYLLSQLSKEAEVVTAPHGTI